MDNIYQFFFNWYHNGIWLPGPPCLELSWFNILCNKNFCCGICGVVGAEWGKKYRSELMFISFWISIVMLILVSVGLASTSLDEDTIKQTYWSYGSGASSTNDVELYIGTNKLLIVTPSSTVGYKYDELNCINDFCEDCKNAASTMVPLVVAAFVTEFPAISTKITRSTAGEDSSCQKFMGVMTTTISMLTTLAALSSYLDQCYRELPSTFIIGSSVNVSMKYDVGPTVVLMIIATWLKVFDIFIHMIVPVELSESRLNGKGNTPTVKDHSTKDTEDENKLPGNKL